MTKSIGVQEFIGLKFNDNSSEDKYLVNMYDYNPKNDYNNVIETILALNTKKGEAYMYNIDEDLFEHYFGAFKNVFLTR